MKPVKARDFEDEVVTQTVHTQAISRGRRRSQCDLRATTLRYLDTLNALAIGFSDHTAVLLPISNYTELCSLSADDLARIELGFAGSTLCLKHRDLHVSIAGLISSSESLMGMAASIIAARNGSRSSQAKASAAKLNGLKGGRPRKVTATTDS